jgi:SPX domain protein involved in polyphosphate accumulation
MNRGVPKDARLEIKFVADEWQEPTLQRWFQLHAAGFSESYPGRWVNSVYFDTYTYRALRQNLDGASHRHKIRYRWYGQRRLPASGALEIKCKRNYFGWKLRYAVDAAPCAQGDRWQDIRRKLISGLPGPARLWLEANPQPVILNRYYRRYLVTHDHKVRATIDSQQCTYDQRYKARPNVEHPANTPRTLVVELKFDRADRQRASWIINGLPLRVSRNSKYVIGIRSVHGF